MSFVEGINGFPNRNSYRNGQAVRGSFVVRSVGGRLCWVFERFFVAGLVWYTVLVLDMSHSIVFCP